MSGNQMEWEAICCLGFFPSIEANRARAKAGEFSLDWGKEEVTEWHGK